MCEKMLEAGSVSFDDLQVENYVGDLQDYWSDNKAVFKLDSVSFLYLWGSLVTWIIIVSLCFIIGIVLYAKLPSEIPIQWSEGMATSLVDKKFIFVYPLTCMMIRFLLRPFLYVRLVRHGIYGEGIAEYLSNYMCFLALSAEVFSILFTYGIVKNIVTVLVVDTAVLMGILLLGIAKMGFPGKQE